MCVSRIWRGLSERATANYLSAAAKYLYPLHATVVRKILGVHTHSGPRQGFACAFNGSVTFRVKTFRLCSDEEHPRNVKHVGLLHDQENRLACEAYSVSQQVAEDYFAANNPSLCSYTLSLTRTF